MAPAFSTAPPSFLGDDGTDVLMRRPSLTDEEEIDPSLFPGTQGRPRMWGDLPAVSSGPAAKAAAVSSAVSPVPPPQQTPDAGPGTGYQDAMTRLEGAYGERPQLSQPKWWQRALGAAAGFGAGWSNAASRTRHPIDVAAMREDVLHPGYNQSLEQWQSRVTPLQAQAEIEGQKQSAWWKNTQLQAQADYMKAHGEYFRHRAEMEQNQWKIDPKTGTLFNTITGERSSPPQTPKDRYDLAKSLNTPEDEAQFYALNGSLQGYGSTLSPDKPDKPTIVPAGATVMNPDGTPGYNNPREFAPQKDTSANSFRTIESTKDTRLLQAEGAARKRISAGEDEGSVMADLLNTKQQIQNDYENEVIAQGGAARHLEYSTGKKGGAQSPAPAAAPAAPAASAPHPAAAKPKYTEAQVRAAAAAKGKDPEAAVAMAREKHLIP